MLEVKLWNFLVECKFKIFFIFLIVLLFFFFFNIKLPILFLKSFNSTIYYSLKIPGPSKLIILVLSQLLFHQFTFDTFRDPSVKLYVWRLIWGLQIIVVIFSDTLETLPKLVEDIVQTSINTGPRGALRLAQGIQAFLGVSSEWLADVSKVSPIHLSLLVRCSSHSIYVKFIQ